MNNYGSNQNLYNQMNFGSNMYVPTEKFINISDPYHGFIKGNMFPDLYKGYKVGSIEIKPMNEQAELLTYIDALTFALIDLSFYLDIYPNDRAMLDAFDKFNNQNKEYMKIYQEKYGPILISDNNSKDVWAWSKSPWPWENS